MFLLVLQHLNVVGVYNPFHTYKCINMTYINIHIFNAPFLDSEQMTNTAVQRRKGIFFFLFFSFKKSPLGSESEIEEQNSSSVF